MYRVGRNKRASAEDLYKTCGTGDCPEDVKRKIEGDTWADRLLKWFGSFIYLGGLGIGTGRGSGGSMGYRPIGAPSRPAPDNVLVRPAVPSEPIIPTDVFPVNTIDPAGTAVIELTDINIPDPSVIDIATSDLGPGEIDIVSARDPTLDVTATSGHPNVITGTDDSVAILDVQPIPPPKRFALDVQNTPTSTHLTVYSQTTHADPDINVFIDSQFDGDIVGDVEEIPLETFNTMQEFEIEEPGPKSSTPVQSLNRLTTRARQLYNRYTEQVFTRNPDFLGPVSRAVQFQFENPAFEPDVTVRFEEDLAELAAAPDPEFRDVRILHRPQFSVTDENLVRVSRLGYRSTMTTRSGLQLGQAVHFYQDISEIQPIDTIELQPINTSHISTTINALGDNTFVNPMFEDSSYSEEDLIDEIVEHFNNAHLVVTSTDDVGDTIQIPTLPPGAPIKVFIDDYASAITILHPHPSELPAVLYPAFDTPLHPVLVIDLYSDDFTLHPSLLKRKRKRSDIF
ncbi:L2 [Gammapapillomavirus 19]|uniref:Minor capsid protein L2 n=2 Tax=Papillomaviridae TaxID=151340 RepID=A0A3R5W7S6_9PAPI|nr:L2 [Gammapapillomavirus 19]QAB13966.1 MAG: L2 protein [Human papillomavirus]